MADLLPWLTLPAAFLLDALVGDPPSLPHPIRWMGRAIEHSEPFWRRPVARERLSGLVVETVLLFYCLSAKSLRQAALEIDRLLAAGEVDRARARVRMIVGRDVDRYGADDIARATVETVAENVVDGVLSPLFFAALGGAPLALAYKMVNTLDSMVGYKNPRYLLFGRAAARIDDAANFLPARLAVPLIALAARRVEGASSRQALDTARREGKNHASPNAGYPEAAFAGALGVRLNGPNVYHGVLVDKPFLGAAFGPVTRAHIARACRLMTWTAVYGGLAAWLLSRLLA